MGGRHYPEVDPARAHTQGHEPKFQQKGARTALISKRHSLITLLRVDGYQHPPLKLLLRHILNEVQRIASLLRWGVKPALVNHEAPFSGNSLRHDEVGGGPIGVTGLERVSLDALTEDLLHRIPPLAPEAKHPVSIHTRVRRQFGLCPAVQPSNRWGKLGLSAEESTPVLLLLSGPERLDVGTVVGRGCRFCGHPDHGAYLVL